MSFHWKKEDYFPYLLQSFKKAVAALEYFVDDLHIGKDQTIESFLLHHKADDYLLGIVRLMSSDNLRVSGNSAYVLGTIAENEDGIERITHFLNNSKQQDSKNALSYLVKLLKTSDYECLMNAAGTIGTISENINGRVWLINQSLLEEIVELSTMLLDNKNVWVSSNAALVIARISIEDMGCQKILSFHSSAHILKKLINSLESDNPGRGMNCAFAIGRICDHENGRMQVLNSGSMRKLIELLAKMIQNNDDNGCTKNACYALSCLASSEQTHRIIIEHDCFTDLLAILTKLVVSVKDPETKWFAAMLLRMFCSFPIGCIRMKSVPMLWQKIYELTADDDLTFDVREELAIILDTLKPLEKPDPVKCEVKSCNQVFCEWNKLILKNSKFTINYLLYQDNECIYNGTKTSFEANNLDPFTQYSFNIQILIVESDEKSALSEPTIVQTDETVPGPPQNVRVCGSTTTVLKIAWDLAEKPTSLIKCYCIYKDDQQIDQTSETSYILSGLQPDTSYEISVCAIGNKGKSEKTTIRATTVSLGDTLPERPTFGLIGKREILVRWQPPQLILGKLNRYDLNMNEKCVYSGVALEYQVTMLKPDTEYKFDVIAITSEGKCKSKMAKARTLKDEYEPDRQPLYPGTSMPNVAKEKTEITERKKSLTKESKMLMPLRRRSKSFFKESVINLEKETLLPEKTDSLYFPSVLDQSRKSSFTKNSFKSFSETAPSSSTFSNKTDNSTSTKYVLSKAKTQIQLKESNNSKKLIKEPTQLNINNKYALNIKEMQPNFPALPILTNLNNNNNNNFQSNFTNSRHLSTINIGFSSTSGNRISSLIKLKNAANSSASPALAKNSHLLFNNNNNANNAESALNSDTKTFNYNILLNKINKKRSAEIHESMAPFLRSNSTYFSGVNHHNHHQREYLNQIAKISK